jgi:hypothetical protein
MSVPSPATISPLTSLVAIPGPLVGLARPNCNYPFPIPAIKHYYYPLALEMGVDWLQLWQ